MANLRVRYTLKPFKIIENQGRWGILEGIYPNELPAMVRYASDQKILGTHHERELIASTHAPKLIER